MDDFATPMIGDNSRLPYDPALFDQHNAKARDWLDAAGAWLDLGRIDTAEQAEKVKEWVDGARKVRKAIDKDFRAAKAPFDASIAKIREDWNPLFNAIDMAVEKLKPMLEEFIQREKAEKARQKAEEAERARKLAEEAERHRARAEQANDFMGQVEAERMAKEAEKAVKAADKPAVVNIGSGVGPGRAMGLATRRVAEVYDYDLAFLEVRDVPAVRVAIDTAISAIVRAAAFDGRRLRGVRVATEEVIR